MKHFNALREKEFQPASLKKYILYRKMKNNSSQDIWGSEGIAPSCIYVVRYLVPCYCGVDCIGLASKFVWSE